MFAVIHALFFLFFRVTQVTIQVQKPVTGHSGVTRFWRK